MINCKRNSSIQLSGILPYLLYSRYKQISSFRKDFGSNKEHNWRLFISIWDLRASGNPHYTVWIHSVGFSCFKKKRQCCNAVLLWSSRNVLLTTKLHLNFHQHARGGDNESWHFWVSCSFKLRCAVPSCSGLMAHCRCHIWIDTFVFCQTVVDDWKTLSHESLLSWNECIYEVQWVGVNCSLTTSTLCYLFNTCC